jgi:hypothetical protein
VHGWLQVNCRRCETEASIPLEHVRRSRDTPVWKLEAALKCRSCRTPRYSPPVERALRSQQKSLHGKPRRKCRRFRPGSNPGPEEAGPGLQRQRNVRAYVPRPPTVIRCASVCVFPQCESLRSVNVRSMLRLKARSTPMRACIAARDLPPPS